MKARASKLSSNDAVLGHQRAVLAYLMTDALALDKLLHRIAPVNFSAPNDKIVAAICDLHDEGKKVNLLTVSDRLSEKRVLAACGGRPGITAIATETTSEALAESALDFILDDYREREAARIFRDGAAGKITLTDALEQLNKLNGGRADDLPPIEDAAELIAKSIVLPDDVIEGLLHRAAKMAVGGASKSRKTWLFIDTAISVATGTDWLGKFPTKRGRVLYINLELSGAWFAKRVRTICDERQIKIESSYLKVWNLRAFAADLSKLLPRLLRGIGRDEFVLIIIDPVYKLLGARDENKAGDIATLLNEIEILAVKTGAAVLFGAHYSKGDQSRKESIDRVSGSGVFARDPDSILNFTRHEQPDCFAVEATLRNHPPIDPFVVRWDYPLFTVDSTLDPEELKKAGRPEKYSARDLLALIEEPMAGSEIVKKAWRKLKIGERRVYELLAELKACDLLKQPKRRGPYEREQMPYCGN